MKKSKGEAALIGWLENMPDVPEPEREYKFHKVRRWRFDFAWPERMTAIEIEGGVWSGGRHTRPSGFVKDAEKYNAAAALGWAVFRFTTQQAISGDAAIWIQEFFAEQDRRHGRKAQKAEQTTH